MESTGDPRCYLSLCPGDEDENYGNSRSISRKLRCGVPMCGFNSGWRYLVVLMVLTTATLVQSSMPEKYPIEVYHMLQERSQYGIGRDNRVRGSWGPWSSWSECSRSCGTGVQSQARECSPPRGLRKRSVMNELNTTSLKPICIGTYKRYHICNTQDCPNYQEDTRAEQCAKFNNRIYKGESYNWVPFLNAPNPCALNCRAVGQRFYATLEPEVLDGTPCDGPNLRGKSTGFTIDRTEQWLCVAGQCRPVGCDGVVGSGAVRDTCGVCGGQGRGCKLFEGIFMEPILPKGHQPVTTIPRGAMSLNISELRYSGNFLALKSDNGSYILNGPNSVSPSGIYKTAGTILKYQRGDKQRMESITGTGPLNESLNLEILFHEMNPGILYKYMLPAPEEIPDDNTVIAPPLYAPGSVANEIPDRNFRIIPSDPVHESLPQMPQSRNQVKDPNNSRKNEEMKFSPTTVMAGDAPTINSSGKKKKKKRKFAWRIRGLTPCSKTCGGGTQTGVLKCVREDTGFEVPDKRCRKIEKPTSPPPLQCNDRPCPARWRADSWSECSVTCGAGVKTRRLECVQDLNSKLTMRVAAGACSQPPDLSTVNSCTGPPCPNPEVRQMISTQRDTPPRWDVGMWGPCSSTCGKGVRTRTVTCITTREPCSQSTKPIDERPCETPCNHPLHHETSSWLQSEWSPKCTDECDRDVETRRIACGDVNESFCDPRERPVTERRCSTNETKTCNEAKWYTGPWSSCSVLCGEGIAYRDVICIGKLLGESKVLSESNCTSTRPHTEEICSMPPCPPEWYTSDWSECSASCGGGMQERIVRCIENNLDSTKCEMRDKPINRKRCNVETCRKEYSYKIPKKVHSVDGCTDKYPNCELVVRAGLCRIKFYKHSCCGCRN